jgi:hypothetical protein
MPPIKVEYPAATPPDLRADLATALGRLGPVSEPAAKSYDINAALLILAGISAAADILATADLLLAWREKARRRNLTLDKVTIVAGNRRISLANVDRDTLVRVLEELQPGP